MKLMKHQIDGVEKILQAKGCYGLFDDCGLGKTVTALEVFKFYYNVDEKIQMFVVCPLSIIESSWKDDIEKFTQFSYANLRTKQPNLDADILLVNYETLISAKFKPILRTILSRNTERMIVCDEAQKISTFNSKTTKYMLELACHCSHRLAMTATPAPNVALSFWSIFGFIDATIFGDNYYRFRNTYFHLVRGKSCVPLAGSNLMHFLSHGYKIEMKPEMKEMFWSKIKSRARFTKKEDVLDLPEAVDVYRKVVMTLEQQRCYKAMKTELVTEIQGQEISVNIALAKLMKLRQITGGFIYGEEGKACSFKDNPKINELREVVDEIGERRIIIFCQYKWEIETIASLFKERAITLYGETKDKEKAIREFREKASGILITHPLSAGVGLSFNACDYMVFYSLSYSFLEYYQAKGRIMRAGKKNRATYIHLLCERSIDEIIYEAVQRKEDNQTLYRRLMR